MELWKDSAGEKAPSERKRRRSIVMGFPRLALRGEQVYMRLNSVLNACSLLDWFGSDNGQDAGLDEPWEESWPPGMEKSSDGTAIGLPRLEGRDRSEN